ncbi:MAG TPA: TonB-dependent receptor [Sphingomicrobium sp.]|nr:TonB-dependent receptor [Sphingomicrobium sp.]
MIASFLLAAADVVVAPADQSNTIVVTASRAPEKAKDSAASVTVIDDEAITRQGDPLVYDFLREIPSAAVSSSGPAGSVTQVRIRGSEANHTLLFIDGIEANDLSGSDQPRFELLNADIASRIEVVRGPQSALWGSQAIGGVINIAGTADRSGYGAAAEGGSYGFLRGSAAGSLISGNMQVAGALGWQRATGIDESGTGGDRDGYHNLSGRALASWTIAPDVRIGINGFSLNGYSQYDGTDPFTFAPTQKLSTRFGMSAGRFWSAFGSSDDGLSGSVSASLFDARNHFLFDGDETNRTSGVRKTISGQLQYAFIAGAIKNQLVAAADYQNENFKSSDTVYGGLSDANKRRVNQAITGEWKAEAGTIVADVAVRHDFFNEFKGATTLRASLLGHLGGGFSVAGSYGEGIAPPTFIEMYGFFPGTFIGNRNLRPETSRGYEVSVRYAKGRFDAAVTGYRQRLHDEIVNNSDFTSSINAPGTSYRSGVELEAGWHLAEKLRLSANYAYLHATQPNDLGEQVEEIRRPKHSGSIALDGSSNRLTYGASLAYVGAHRDTDFDLFPSKDVQLGSYWLASARLAYAIRPGIELFVRGSNLLNQHYEDVIGYRTEGRGIYGGFRLSHFR